MINTIFTFSKKIILFCSLIVSIAIHSQSVATYNITFTSVWNSNDHGTLPSNAHWSHLVGANHNTANEFLQMGTQASQGIENVAEEGSNAVFLTEINNRIIANTAEQFIDMSSVPNATGSVTINGLEVSDQYPLLTLVSMIAPSPDWFIAMNSFDLRQNGDWITSANFDLFPYDAGTENGNTYSGNNTATMPQENITSLVDVNPFNDQRVGYFTITLVSVLGIDEIESIQNIYIYPNPSKGEISIVNKQQIHLKTLEIYSVIGELVKKVSLENSTVNTIDLTNINKGIYLIKFISNLGNIKTQKLILE